MLKKQHPVHPVLHRAIDYNSKEQEPIWEALQNFLAQKINEQNQTTRQLGLEELQIWCKAKLQKTTMAEIIRQEQQDKMPKK